MTAPVKAPLSSSRNATQGAALQSLGPPRPHTPETASPAPAPAGRAAGGSPCASPAVAPWPPPAARRARGSAQRSRPPEPARGREGGQKGGRGWCNAVNHYLRGGGRRREFGTCCQQRCTPTPLANPLLKYAAPIASHIRHAARERRRAGVVVRLPITNTTRRLDLAAGQRCANPHPSSHILFFLRVA